MDDITTALCNVCRNAGATDRDTLDTANRLQEDGRTAEWVTGFGEWYEQWEQGKPFLKHIISFGEDYDAKRIPHFAKKKNGKADIDALLKAIRQGQRNGLTANQFSASLAPEQASQWQALGSRWADVKRLSEKQTDALRFRLMEVAQ